MLERTNTAAAPRRMSLRAASMSAAQRRREMVDLIAAGLARTIAQRTEPPSLTCDFPEESVDHGLALSAVSRLSVHTGATPGRNEIKVGEQA